jgi:hypothetical protein
MTVWTEDAIYTLVIATITAGLAARSVSGVHVQKAYQPRTVGAPTGGSILLSNGIQHRYGFLGRADKWTTSPDQMTHTETQTMEFTIQVNAMVVAPPPPAALPATKAGDLVELAARILASDAGVAQLRAGGLGIERIPDIRKPYFSDDMNQFEASPSFDFTLSYSDVEVTTGPIISETELDVLQV